MTEIQAIKMSLDMWKWLNKNPLKKKEDYPQFSLVVNMLGRCPCCEYYLRQKLGFETFYWSDELTEYRKQCQCPLNIMYRCSANCAGGNYDQWKSQSKFGDVKGSTTASQYIVDKLQERYDELIKNNKEGRMAIKVKIYKEENEREILLALVQRKDHVVLKDVATGCNILSVNDDGTLTLLKSCSIPGLQLDDLGRIIVRKD